MKTTRCDRTPAWAVLAELFESSGRGFDLRAAFAAEPARFERFSQSAPHVFADLSKNLIDTATEQALLALAQQSGLEQHRDAMFGGEHINTTENRQVMHWLLRNPPLAQMQQAGEAIKTLADELSAVHTTLDAMLAYAQAVRADAGITDVVNIGIGGSDLGPQMAVLALDEFVTPAKRFHFVSNVDGHELAAVLKKVRPAEHLVPDRQEYLHHHRDDDQRALGQSLV